MEENRPRRRELLPLARTQLKLVTVVCLPIVLACVIVAALQTYFFLTSIRQTFGTQDEFAREVISMSVKLAAIPLLVLLPVFIFLVVWISYRIVGPMRRLSLRLEEIGKGKLRGGFSFRVGDELTFVADAVAEMEEGLIERLAACREASAEEELRERLDAFDLPSPPEAQSDQPDE